MSASDKAGDSAPKRTVAEVTEIVRESYAAEHTRGFHQAAYDKFGIVARPDDFIEMAEKLGQIGVEAFGKHQFSNFVLAIQERLHLPYQDEGEYVRVARLRGLIDDWTTANPNNYFSLNQLVDFFMEEMGAAGLLRETPKPDISENELDGGLHQKGARGVTKA